MAIQFNSVALPTPFLSAPPLLFKSSKAMEPMINPILEPFVDGLVEPLEGVVGTYRKQAIAVLVGSCALSFGIGWVAGRLGRRKGE